jgi:hypothetical protein
MLLVNIAETCGREGLEDVDSSTCQRYHITAYQVVCIGRAAWRQLRL